MRPEHYPSWWTLRPAKVGTWRNRRRRPKCCLEVLVFAALGCWTIIFLRYTWASSSQHWRTRIDNEYIDVAPGHTLPSSNELGAVVLLAPPRKEVSMWGIDRFCFLLGAVRSIDMFLNSKYGPYPIYILVARDWQQDRRVGYEASYSAQDRSLIRQWAPHSSIHFVEVDMYSGKHALEPNTTIETIHGWRKGNDDAIAGSSLGYASMCRLWSGRLQNMKFLASYKYYMRMDDDSLLTEPVSFDPFQRMETEHLSYAYRRRHLDVWGIEQLWELSEPFLNTSMELPFLWDGQYSGEQPYNNFHVSAVQFWRSAEWQMLWKAMNRRHLFFKFRVGDANVHAIALMMMHSLGLSYGVWPDFPYVHNSNDMPEGWADRSWKEECQAAYRDWLR